MNKEPIKRYSQAFKQQIVREYEASASNNSLHQKSGIGAHQMVERGIFALKRSEALETQSLFPAP